MLTRDQRYAEDAFTRVKDFKAHSKAGGRKQYTATAKELPVLIRTAGLLQALYFIERSKFIADKRMADHVAQTVGKANRDALLDDCRTVSLPEYMRLTEQVLAACAWYKRVAQVLLETPDKKEPAPDATPADAAFAELGG